MYIKMKLVRPVELLSAYTCMIPFSLTYFFDKKSFVNIALLLHMPPRVLYYLHRSFSNDLIVSQELHKYYIICLFTSTMLIRYEWEKFIDIFDILYYIMCVLFVIQANLLAPVQYRRLEFYMFTSIIKSTFYIYNVSKFMYFASLYCSLISLFVYNDKKYGKYTVPVINIIMLPAYYFMLSAVERIS